MPGLKDSVARVSCGKARLPMALCVPSDLLRSLPTTLPLAHVSDLLARLGDTKKQGTRRKHASVVTHELGKVHTPYGTLIEELTIGDNFKCSVVNPHAFLNFVTHRSPEYGDIIKACRQDHGKVHLALYSDTIRTGNILRPDSNRAYECLYWGIAELPDWFQSRDQGWLPCAIVKEDKLKDLPGGLGALMKAICLKAFSPHSWNLMKVGVTIMTTEGEFLMKVNGAKLLCDEKAIKATWSLKGASGTKFCFCCKNVVRRITSRTNSRGPLTSTSIRTRASQPWQI